MATEQDLSFRQLSTCSDPLDIVREKGKNDKTPEDPHCALVLLS